MLTFEGTHVDGTQFSSHEMAHSLEKVLTGWRGLYDLESDDHGRGTELWRFTEATHIGLFAAAAWNAGHPAFMELVTDKKKKGASRGSSGRCDLILRIENEPLFVEAKRSRPIITSRTSFDEAFKKLEARFTSARIDARRTRKGRWGVGRLSLMIVVPRIRCREPDQAYERAMAFTDKLIEWASGNEKASFYAAAFVEDKNRLLELGRFRKKTGTVFPGVLAIGRLHGKSVRAGREEG